MDSAILRVLVKKNGIIAITLWLPVALLKCLNAVSPTLPTAHTIYWSSVTLNGISQVVSSTWPGRKGEEGREEGR